MKNTKAASAIAVLQNLPSVDELLRTPQAIAVAAEHGSQHAADIARRVIDNLRQDLRESGGKETECYSAAELLERAENRFVAEYDLNRASRIQRVINATGVMIHTNLGRAPLSEKCREAIISAAGYATVEYDLVSGTRGKRGSYAESLICEMTGAEAALIVNNCAAAALLILTVFAAGGEVVISRGELVEIGGDFRVPDVLSQSGATLREVGTTNRTKLADYEKAFSDQTRMLLKVHPSNYRIVGFSSSPTLSDLVALARSRGVILYEDAGSGALFDLSRFGIVGEPVISESIAAGVDLITFSGDKLLGACQAGIIVGKSALIEQIRRHSLYRALRVDKLAYAVLEAALASYRKGTAVEEIPVLRMLSMTKPQIAERADVFAKKLFGANVSVEIIDGKSVVGGGSAPDYHPETSLLALSHPGLSAERLEYALRNSTPPVIARIDEGKVLLDLRTVAEVEENELVEILKEL